MFLFLSQCKLLCICEGTEEGCKWVSGDVLVIIALVSHLIGAYTPSTNNNLVKENYIIRSMAIQHFNQNIITITEASSN